MAHIKGYYKEYYRKRISIIIEILGGKCVYCGSTEKLEVDHIDPRNKSFQVQPWKKWLSILEELKKCQCLCKKCHRKKTIKESIGDNRIGGIKKKAKHGTNSMYQKGCRCGDCKVASHQYYLRKIKK